MVKGNARQFVELENGLQDPRPLVSVTDVTHMHLNGMCPSFLELEGGYNTSMASQYVMVI